MKKYFPPAICFLLILALLFSLISWLTLAWICVALAGLKIVNRFPSSLIHWVHAMVFEFFGILLVWCLRPVGYLWKLQSKGGDGRPILLIHGYLHDSSAWVYHKWQLRRHGFGPIYMLNLGYPFLSIHEYIKKAAIKASQIARETGRSDLILIGHSMGGIVSALYAIRSAPLGTVTDVITIGSPLAGTHVAKIAFGPDAREMERNSEFIKGVPAEIRKYQNKIRFYHIATKTDQLVIPYTSELIEGPSDRQFVLNDIGHVSLLYSPRVARKIISWLTN